ncbi:hypothetical protein FIBSPDRAFT_862205, partial [Athelia psychrophila]
MGLGRVKQSSCANDVQTKISLDAISKMVITDHYAVGSCQSAQEVYLLQSSENPARSINASHCCASESTR